MENISCGCVLVTQICNVCSFPFIKTSEFYLDCILTTFHHRQNEHLHLAPLQVQKHELMCHLFHQRDIHHHALHWKRKKCHQTAWALMLTLSKPKHVACLCYLFFIILKKKKSYDSKFVKMGSKALGNTLQIPDLNPRTKLEHWNFCMHGTPAWTAEPLPKTCFWSSMQCLFQNKSLMVDVISPWMFLL